MTNKKTVILSIDGGGVKGTIPIMILREIENLIGKPLSEKIDYFTGTSAGALIGAALALKDEVDTEKVLGMMDKVMKNIFERENYGFGLFDSKYDRSEFDNQLEEFFKNTKLSETKFPISVSAFNLNDYTPKIWSTLESLKNPSEDALLKDILGATAAAPYYFDPKQINDNFYIDGGLFNNTPTISGYVDFVKNTKSSTVKTSPDDCIVISLGTGKVSHNNTATYANFGILDWIFTKDNLFDIALSSPALRDQALSQDLFGKNYYRLNPALPEELSSLDDHSEKNLLQLKNIAQKYINENQDLLHKIANILIENDTVSYENDIISHVIENDAVFHENDTVSHDYEAAHNVGYFDYLKNGIYSVANNLKTPIKVMAGILTISYEGFKLFSIKLSTKHSIATSGNEFLKNYHIDELKSIFAIASASYGVKASLSETYNSTTYLSDDSDITDHNTNLDVGYDIPEPIFL